MRGYLIQIELIQETSKLGIAVWIDPKIIGLNNRYQFDVFVSGRNEIL